MILDNSKRSRNFLQLHLILPSLLGQMDIVLPKPQGNSAVLPTQKNLQSDLLLNVERAMCKGLNILVCIFYVVVMNLPG